MTNQAPFVTIPATTLPDGSVVPAFGYARYLASRGADGKVQITADAAGVPFLGYVVWPGHISAGRYIRHRYHQRLRQHEAGARNRSESLVAYRAMLNHTGSTRGRKAA